MPLAITISVQPGGPEGASVTHYECAVALEGRRWFFTFYTGSEAADFVQRTEPNPDDVSAPPAAPVADGWYFDIGPNPAPVAPTLVGVPLSNGLDLLFPYRHLDVPPGPLFVVEAAPKTGLDPDPAGFSDGRYSLVYVDYSVP